MCFQRGTIMLKLRQVAMFVSLVALMTNWVMGQNATPTAAVTSFYKFDRSHSQDFNRRSIDARKRWFSRRFYNLFLAELRKQNAHLKTHPTEKPFFGDGFSFSPLEEPCDADGRSLFRKYSIQNTSTKTTRAVVPVRFSYPKPCKAEAIVWKLKLVKTGSGWVIDDLIYGDGSSLSADMKKHRY
jgi:hypothetical protein